jgi:hypothetical protein
LGFDVSSQSVYAALETIAHSNIEPHYCYMNLLEASWQAVRALKRNEFDRNTFRDGLQSIENGERYHEIETTAKAYEIAIDLYSLGHVDMIDNLLYSIAVLSNLYFLTLDSPFVDFLRKNGLHEIIITVDELHSNLTG